MLVDILYPIINTTGFISLKYTLKHFLNKPPVSTSNYLIFAVDVSV